MMRKSMVSWYEAWISKCFHIVQFIKGSFFPCGCSNNRLGSGSSVAKATGQESLQWQRGR